MLKRIISFTMVICLCLSLACMMGLAAATYYIDDNFSNAGSNYSGWRQYGGLGPIGFVPDPDNVADTVLYTTATANNAQLAFQMKQSRLIGNVESKAFTGGNAAIEFRFRIESIALTGFRVFDILSFSYEESAGGYICSAYGKSYKVPSMPLAVDRWHKVKMGFYNDMSDGNNNKLLSLTINDVPVTEMKDGTKDLQLAGLPIYSAITLGFNATPKLFLYLNSTEPTTPGLYLDDFKFYSLPVPSVTSVLYNGSTDDTQVDTRGEISVTFDGAMTGSTLTNTTVVLRNLITCTNVEYTGEYNELDKTYTVDYSAVPLMPDAPYALIVTPSVKDEFGQAMSEYSTTFYTKTPTDEIIKNVVITPLKSNLQSGVNKFNVTFENNTGGPKDVCVQAVLCKKIGQNESYIAFSRSSVNIDTLQSGDLDFSFDVPSAQDGESYFVRFLFWDTIDDMNALTSSMIFDNEGLKSENN